MTQVWKCDYCNSTARSQKHMKTHEENCDFGPDKKKCWTCKHRVLDWYNNNECRKGHSCYEVEDQDGPCEYWEGETK